MENASLKKELIILLKDRISLSESTRANFARGEDTYDPILSQAVVFPETNEEVSNILKLCNQHKVPVVPFGTGTSLEGHVVGNKSGITFSKSEKERVLGLKPYNMSEEDWLKQVAKQKQKIQQKEAS